MEKIINKRLKTHPDTLPTILDYKEFLAIICKRNNLDRDEARKKYGQFTYGQ